MNPSSPSALLLKRRFLPLFITQLLGAFNDNLFKQSLVLIILYRLGGQDQSLLVNLCALLFILPFFLFSALGGQFGERFAKDALMRALKLAEILIMLVGAAGICWGNLPLMLAALFCMGSHSALFGPVKYSILPQHLQGEELVDGNALVETGTFLAILAGTIGAGLLMSQDHYAAAVSVAVALVALFGYLASRGIPRAHAALPELRLDWNILRQSWETLRLGLSGQHVSVSRSLLGNSWFWFLGATYLTQIPAYAKDWLHGDESVVTLILTVFSVGIALGSMLCARLSRGRLELGLVPLGAIGLTLCGLLLYWHSDGFPAGNPPKDWLALLLQGRAWWVLVDILGLGVFGGFYIVPLYTLIQVRTEESQRSRVVAANNILNALLMVISAIVAILLLSVVGLSIPQLFLAVSLLNLAVNGYLFRAAPEFVMRFLVWVFGRFLYRVEHRGLEAIPEEGAALLVCSPLSALDVLLIGDALRRPVHFALVGHGEAPLARESAWRQVAGWLENGELVCLFPNGKPAGDGEVKPFGGELERILRRCPVPVIPVSLQGIPGTQLGRKSALRLFRRWLRGISLIAGAPLAPEALDFRGIEEQVAMLHRDLL